MSASALLSSLRAKTSPQPASRAESSSSKGSTGIEGRLRRLEITQDKHSKAIVYHDQTLQRLASAQETILFVVDSNLKKTLTDLLKQWQETKPNSGPHPLGGPVHVLLACITEHYLQMLQQWPPEKWQVLYALETAQALKEYTNASNPEDLKDKVCLEFQRFQSMAIKMQDVNGKPFGKKCPDDKPWGWSLMFGSGQISSKQKDWMSIFSQPIWEMEPAISVRGGRYRKNQLIEEIAGQVKDWQRPNNQIEAPEEDAAMTGDADDRTEAANKRFKNGTRKK